jgi:hypothetical protein
MASYFSSWHRASVHAATVLLATVLAPLWTGRVGGDELRVQEDGVSLHARTFRDAVIICINAQPPLRIASSDYGVRFEIERNDRRFWNEAFPKTVTGPGWYFDLPLRIELKTRGDVQRRRIDVDLGTCSEATLCNPVKLLITLPPYDHGLSAAAACSE